MSSKGVDLRFRNINGMLFALGLLPTAGDETFTAETTAAVKKFQTEHQLEETGVVNKETAMAIDLALNQLITEHDKAYNEAVKLLLK